MLWILCQVIKEITVLCPRQGWTFPDSQPYTLKWNSLVPTLDSSSLIALCVRLISFLTALIYDTLSAAFFFEILKGYWCTEAKHHTCQSVMMSETASPASALLPHLLCTWSWHSVAAWLNLAPAATARPLSCPALLLLYECLRGEACVRGLRWSQRAGDESDEHLSGDVISSERWWPAPAVSVQWGTLCSTCLKAF